MQKLFIVKESCNGIDIIQDFIGVSGKIISVTANFVATSSSTRQSGRWLVVADDGKSENLLP